MSKKHILIAIVVLALCILISNRNRPGRYVISTANNQGVYVLDTKTGEVWLRREGIGNVYLGTNEKPTYVKIKQN